MTIKRVLATLLVVSALPLTTPAAAQEAPSLPGGASSLQETYQDWRVACRATDGTRHCSASQQAQQDGQRVLVIELQTDPEGGVTGTLVLPFGLRLEAGVTLQVDDHPPLDPLRFRTCLPVGCIVPLSFEAETVQALRAGTRLKILAEASDSDDEVALAVSLKGLTASLDRTAALTAE